MTDTERAEYDDVVRQLMAKCEELAAENARLRSSENSAHAVLREVYNDPTASPAVRVKAAGLALPHETPRLTPVAPAIDATAEEIIPLADLVRQRRARIEQMEREEAGRSIKVLPNGQVLLVDDEHTGGNRGGDTAG
jgi:hypothetical protein